MAKNIYRTAQGKIVDIDKLRLANESTIAVGNMKTNARGDQLGHGGEVVKTRAQLMQEYYALSTNVAEEETPESLKPAAPPAPKLRTTMVTEEPVTPVAQPAAETTTAKKSSLADQVAEDLANKGIQRI